ncbi:hypothetical protein Patl1_05650 [Pistacia atlantica]|uniref:Uncharacterized protein n=1 Tax=Pistacia atlantica TaxID=434234 RepID=A0ACC1BX01_9ROSI|nr:hypothetical protein Patl1_05650 [Pistacia atlantica]
MEKSDNVCVRFTGKNYAAWEFQLETFLKGKTLWGHIDGNSNGGSTAEMSAKAMWNYLKQVHKQDNNARRFQLELAIANYTQGDLSVQDYYSGFLALWNDYSDLVTAKACFGELLREEQRLNTQNIMEQSRVASNTVSVAYDAHGKGKGRDMSTTQCYSCKKYGHIAPNCPQKFCNYCKQPGHTLLRRSLRSSLHASNKVYHVLEHCRHGIPNGDLQAAPFPLASPVLPSAPLRASWSIGSSPTVMDSRHL